MDLCLAWSVCDLMEAWTMVVTLQPWPWCQWYNWSFCHHIAWVYCTVRTVCTVLKVLAPILAPILVSVAAPPARPLPPMPIFGLTPLYRGGEVFTAQICPHR